VAAGVVSAAGVVAASAAASVVVAAAVAVVAVVAASFVELLHADSMAPIRAMDRIRPSAAASLPNLRRFPCCFPLCSIPGFFL
jgi:hypothetical protein